jgi:hypothetical protein
MVEVNNREQPTTRIEGEAWRGVISRAEGQLKDVLVQKATQLGQGGAEALSEEKSLKEIREATEGLAVLNRWRGYFEREPVLQKKIGDLEASIEKTEDHLSRLYDVAGIGNVAQREAAEEALAVQTNQLTETKEALDDLTPSELKQEALTTQEAEALKQTESEEKRKARQDAALFERLKRKASTEGLNFEEQGQYSTLWREAKRRAEAEEVAKDTQWSAQYDTKRLAHLERREELLANFLPKEEKDELARLRRAKEGQVNVPEASLPKTEVSQILEKTVSALVLAPKKTREAIAAERAVNEGIKAGLAGTEAERREVLSPEVKQGIAEVERAVEKIQRAPAVTPLTAEGTAALKALDEKQREIKAGQKLTATELKRQTIKEVFGREFERQETSEEKEARRREIDQLLDEEAVPVKATWRERVSQAVSNWWQRLSPGERLSRGNNAEEQRRNQGLGERLRLWPRAQVFLAALALTAVLGGSGMGREVRIVQPVAAETTAAAAAVSPERVNIKTLDDLLGMEVEVKEGSNFWASAREPFTKVMENSGQIVWVNEETGASKADALINAAWKLSRKEGRDLGVIEAGVVRMGDYVTRDESRDVLWRFYMSKSPEESWRMTMSLNNQPVE